MSLLLSPLLFALLGLNLLLAGATLLWLWRQGRSAVAATALLERRCIEAMVGGLADLQQVAREEARQGRAEVAASLVSFGQLVPTQMGQVAAMQQGQLETFAKQLQHLTHSNEQRLENLRQVVEQKLGALQADNAQKLEQMRLTVDEKLHATLETRLGESFKLVGERLDLVNRGLGEMQTLAAGVGDLKKVLTNVKTRGTWGEVQLGNLLSQIFTPQQYACEVAVNPNSRERVEYAIRLPGQGSAGEAPIWLPIDAKFPQEDYQRLVDAAEASDAEQVRISSAALEARILSEAKKIREKYIQPPHTTDFAILFLPTEGLFAEVLRRPGLCDTLLLQQRVLLAGPTTLAATLSSLQMGFRTLAITERSSEVWQILGEVKNEFGKFGSVLDKVQKKLHQASNEVESATRRTRVLTKKLSRADNAEVPAAPTPGLFPT